MTDLRDEAKGATTSAAARSIDMKSEVTAIPVSDIDRAKRFYGSLGWRLDGDFVVGDTFRGAQFTPPGSPASIHFGKGSRRRRPARRPGSFSSSPTLRRHAPSWLAAVSM